MTGSRAGLHKLLQTCIKVREYDLYIYVFFSRICQALLIMRGADLPFPVVLRNSYRHWPIVTGKIYHIKQQCQEIFGHFRLKFLL